MSVATKKRVVPVDLRNLPEVCNPIFWPLFADEKRYLVLKGGGSSGKSVFAAQKLIYRTLAEPGHKFLVVRKVKADLRDSAFAELKNVIRAWGMENLFLIPTGRSSELYLKCLVNGNEIIFYGLDDVERRKSLQGITGMWTEEASELTVEDFRQLDIRMRGVSPYYKQIILTFNPIVITHWLKGEFFDSLKPNATTHHSTYQDNQFLPAEDRAVLEGFKGVDDYYYTVYCLGEWGVTGKTVYNAQAVTERLLAVKGCLVKRGVFVYRYETEKIVDSSIRFVPDDSGPLSIYAEPETGVPYVLGGDISEGGADWSTGSVRDNLNWNQMATWRGQMDTDLYAKQMYCLGKYYNEALIGIETNFDLHPVKELRRLGYNRQYAREVLDDITKVRQHKHGFKTTRVTRPVIIAKHVALAREHLDTFHDAILLDEMLTFARNEEGRPEAQEGAHDDMIFADAIALEIREQQRMKRKEPKQELTGTYAYGELLLLGYTPAQIRKLKKVKIIGRKPKGG